MSLVKNPIESMEEAYCLKGKNAIVTGGNRGIGYGIASAFAQQGANVAIFCRNKESGEAAAAEFAEKYEGKFAFYQCDISSMEQCRNAVADMVHDFGGVDILVNNAGVAVAGEVLDMDEDLSDWFHCIDIDLNGAMRMCYVVGKYMRDAGKGGKVINITSNSGSIINKPMTFAPYHAAKAALNHLTRDLAVEWGKYGINVNAIAPGYTFTDIAAKMPREPYEGRIEKVRMGPSGQTIELGALAVFLASEASNIVTGTIVTADGGYSLAV
ncbi:MAG: SDR family oxidoreductase [Oscillospiraceae bacterium]|nr:SDR family oxidoreductase [Oscillospiraceae bacterium]